jgi:hypothetical protein
MPKGSWLALTLFLPKPAASVILVHFQWLHSFFEFVCLGKQIIVGSRNRGRVVVVDRFLMRGFTGAADIGVTAEHPPPTSLSCRGSERPLAVGIMVWHLVFQSCVCVEIEW